MAEAAVFDTRAFRDALGAFATGVTIVTTRTANGEPVGVTANSFNSVSLEPPMILWSLAKSSRSLAAFEAADYWAVHILAADQEALSNRFAKSSADKFANIDTHAGLGNAPLLPNCACCLQCKTAFKYEGGDHVIFVGEVIDFHRSNTPILVFHGGKYALATRKVEPELLSGNEPRDSDVTTGEDFLGYLLWRAYLHFNNRVARHLKEHSLDGDSFMILAMLLHRDGRSLDQLANGLLQSGQQDVVHCTAALAARGWIRIDKTNDKFWLTEAGRDVTLKIHAASKVIEADLLGRLDAAEGMAFKHLLRQFILHTDSGLPHPWQTTVVYQADSN